MARKSTFRDGACEVGVGVEFGRLAGHGELVQLRVVVLVYLPASSLYLAPISYPCAGALA